MGHMCLGKAANSMMVTASVTHLHRKFSRGSISICDIAAPAVTGADHEGSLPLLPLLPLIYWWLPALHPLPFGLPLIFCIKL
jgi:hypothetical protein